MFTQCSLNVHSMFTQCSLNILSELEEAWSQQRQSATESKRAVAAAVQLEHDLAQMTHDLAQVQSHHQLDLATAAATAATAAASSPSKWTGGGEKISEISYTVRISQRQVAELHAARDQALKQVHICRVCAE
jgi:hypothetical protein